MRRDKPTNGPHSPARRETLVPVRATYRIGVPCIGKRVFEEGKALARMDDTELTEAA